LKETIAPGSTGGWTVFDARKAVPSDVRSYTIDSDSSRADPGAGAIRLPVPARDVIVDGEEVSSDGVTWVLLELQVRFQFNENVCEWYDKYGKTAEPLNFNAPEGEKTNWTDWLLNSFYKRITEAARPVVAEYDWLQLTTNESVAVEGEEGTTPIFSLLAQEVSAELSEQLSSGLGGNFFCGPGYTFDGSVDGEIDNCPALVVEVDSIRPENDTLLTNYETIVANAEAQLKVESDRDLSIATAEANSEIAKAESREASEAAVAAAEAEEATKTAEAATDLAVAEAEEAVRLQDLENAKLAAEAQAAYCSELAEAGIDCAALAYAEQGVIPSIIIGDGGAIPNIWVDPDDAPVTPAPEEE
jgi:hypothetical protein